MPESSSIVKWQAADENPAAYAGQLDIWLLNLDVLPCRHDWLDTIERLRLEAFKHGAAQQQFCAVRSALRQIIARYLRCSPESVSIRINAGGKPYLGDPSIPLQFNLSHAGNTMLLATRLEHAVGVDVEIPRALANIERLARRTFGQHEIRQLEATDWSPALFFKTWTRMEARQKCQGRGVFGIPVSSRRVETMNFRPAAELSAAVAWPADARPGHIRYLAF